MEPRARTPLPPFMPMAPEVLADPYPFYDAYRSHAPVFKTQFGAWFVTRHADVHAVLRDRRFGKTERDARAAESGRPHEQATARMLVHLNPPDHTAIRAVMNRALPPQGTTALRAGIEATAQRLVDAVAAEGRMDLVRSFSFPLPFQVICDLLGIPPGDRPAIAARNADVGRSLDLVPMSRADQEAADERIRFLSQYFDGQMERRADAGADDVIGRMLQPDEQGRSVSRQDLVFNLILLFNAGHETTASLIGNCVSALCRHPEAMARVVRDPGLIRTGLDELCRFDTSVQFASRTALVPLELGGQAIAAGDVVLLSLGAANRDPEVYDEPHALKLERAPAAPLASFGGGIHYCFGTQLARLQLEVALQVLTQRLPGLRLAAGQPPRWRRSFLFRGPQELPLEWDA